MKETTPLIIFLVIVLLILVILMGMHTISSNQCKAECKNKGALASELIEQGTFKKDVCMCIYSNKIEAFKLE